MSVRDDCPRRCLSTLPLLAIVLSLFLAPGAAAEQGPPEGDTPRDTGVTDKAVSELVQVAVSVLRGRKRDEPSRDPDFSLWVNHEPVERFTVDGFCPRRETAEHRQRPCLLDSRVFLFYFDQPQLTVEGRHNAITIARDSVPELVHGGARAMLVSNGKDLRVFCEMTGDAARLLSALDEMEQDPDHRSTAATLEDMRIARLEDEIEKTRSDHDFQTGTQLRQLRKSGGLSAIDALKQAANEQTMTMVTTSATAGRLASVARGSAADEIREAERSFERLMFAMKLLGEHDPPQFLLLFADNLRKNAGEHYYRLLRDHWLTAGIFDTSLQGNSSKEPSMMPGVFDGALGEAGSRGIRIYAIQPQGLISSSGNIRDAQSTLVTMASETGGRSFLRGEGADRIVESIRMDTECVYVLSFPPGGLPRDRPLPLRVAIEGRRERVSSQGLIQIPSAESKAISRTLRLFLNPTTRNTDSVLGIGVIPLDYRNGEYEAMIQLVLSGRKTVSPAGQRLSWDVGVSIVGSGPVGNVAASLRWEGSDGSPTFSRTVRLPVGSVRLVGVGVDTSTNEGSSAAVDLDWPKAEKGVWMVPTVAILTPSDVTTDQEGGSQEPGFRVVPEASAVPSGAPVALVSLICQKGPQERTVTVSKRLVGLTGIGFPSTEIAFDSSECAQIRDVVPPGALGPGLYRYEVLAVDRFTPLARAARDFEVSDPGAESESTRRALAPPGG